MGRSLRRHFYGTMPAKPPENRYASQNYQHAVKGIWPIFAEGVVKEKSRNGNEESGNEGITQHAIRPLRLWIAPAKNEDRTARDHIKEPLRKNSERKELAEIPS